MTVQIDTALVRLVGSCGVEDAEPLLGALEDKPTRPIDVSDLARAHMAVVQLLIIARPPIRGVPKNVFLRDMLVPLLATGETDQSHIVGGTLPV